MPIAPPVFVDRATTPAVPRFGLLSIAEMPDDGGDRAVYNGIEYQLPAVPQATAAATDCLPAPEDERELDEGLPFGESEPIRAWAGWQCSPVGLSERDVAQHATQKLIAAEGPFLEKQVWSEATPSLMGEGTVLVQGTAVPLAVGVGLLEAWLYEHYAGVGALHVPRSLGAFADHKGILHASGSKIATLAGTPVALGAYPNLGPNPDPEEAGLVAPAAGSFWIVASGDVVVRRTPVQVQTARGGTGYVNARTNTVQGIAERSWAVAFDQVSAAALVNLT